MTPMDTIILSDKNKIPDNESLKTAIGKSYKTLEDLLQYIEAIHGTVIPEWKFYSVKYGWTLKTLLKKRNLFFVSPRKDYFKIAFVFGDKAVNEIMESQLQESIKTELQNTRKYAEGRGISFEVKNDELLNDLKMLVSIKVRN